MTASANLALVRSIYAKWTHGDFTSAAWAHPEIEFSYRDGPNPGCWSGVEAMAATWRDYLSNWREYRANVEEYRELDHERVLVLMRASGVGRTSGVEVARVASAAANLFTIREGKVVALVLYFDRARALADLGLAPDGEVAARSAGADDHAGAPALLDVAIEAARLGGSLLLERARRGAQREVATKSTPTDLVSEADHASERAIRELLARRRPEDGFLGEEGGRSREGRSGLSWIVDPLDGTVNFIFGIPQWCVSVAVGNREGVLAGAIYDPNREELFCATDGGVARMSGPGGEVELRGPRRGAEGERTTGGDELARAMIATGLYYDAEVRGAQARVLARLAGRVRDIRRFGSAALDLAWTAAGRYDAYFERGVQQWDVAAGTLICERAGLEVRELPVQERLPRGVLAAPPALAPSLFELVQGA